MKNFKKFVLNEIKETIKKSLGEKKIIRSAKNLYNMVSLSEKVDKVGNEESKRLSEMAVKVMEKKLIEHFHELDTAGCSSCQEGEGRMLKAQLLSIISNAKKLLVMIHDEDQFEDWIQSKITIAEDYVRVAQSYMMFYNSKSGTTEPADLPDEEYGPQEPEEIHIDEPSGHWEDVTDDYVNGDARVSGSPIDGLERIAIKLASRGIGDAQMQDSSIEDALSDDVSDEDLFEAKAPKKSKSSNKAKSPKKPLKEKSTKKTK